MHYLIQTKISIIIIMLILSVLMPLKIHSLPLTETIFTIPEGEIELTLQEQIHKLKNNYRLEQLGLGFGILPDLSLWFYSQFLHEGFSDTNKNDIGDTFLKFLYFISSLHNDSIHIGLLFKFRFPTGEDTYSISKWRPVSFGNNEIKVGPVIQFNLIKHLYFNFNFLYFFREGENENLYSGFRFKLLRKETYKKVFGLNPFINDTFLEKSRLKNDYTVIAFSINTDKFSPIIPYIECQRIKRIANPRGDDREFEPVPLSSDPFLLSSGIRYFLSMVNYLGFYMIINPIDSKDHFKTLAGFELGLQF